MINAFGPNAERFALGMPDIEAVIAEPSTLYPAYLHAVERRMRGDFFYGMVLAPEAQSQIAFRAALGVARTIVADDDRMLAMRLLADGQLLMDGRTVKDRWEAVDANEVAVRREFYSLCDAVLVRSDVEAARVTTSMFRPRQTERILVEPRNIPDVRAAPVHRQPVTVVVWAPQLSFEQMAFHALALSDFIGEVVLIGSGGVTPPVRGAFLVAEHPRAVEALQRACVVVCAQPDDPGDAVAFARRGYGVVAPRSSGSHEFVRDVATYDPVSAEKLWFAIAIALTRPASPVPTPPSNLPRQPLPPAAPVPPDDLPLVTVITPTFNRRDELAGVLENVAAQRYPNVEHIVINDGGVEVADLVARYPRVRLIEHAENRGGHQGSLTGMANARGEYFQLLADDDRMYPDHIERLVYAMLRTGAPAAHGNAIIRYQEQRPDGTWRTNGYNASTFNFSTMPFEAMVCTPIAGQAILFHRRVLNEIGPMRGDSDLADQEMQLRLWNAYPVVWVDHVTCEWSLRGKTNFSARADVSEEMRRIFDELHPTPPDRPILAKYRAATLQNIKNRPPGFTFKATFTWIEQPAPLTAAGPVAED